MAVGAGGQGRPRISYAFSVRGPTGLENNRCAVSATPSLARAAGASGARRARGAAPLRTRAAQNAQNAQMRYSFITECLERDLRSSSPALRAPDGVARLRRLRAPTQRRSAARSGPLSDPPRTTALGPAQLTQPAYD